MAISAEYLAFLESDRLSEPTRAVVKNRLAGPGPAEGVLDAAQERTLRALLARVVPGTELDLAGYVMARLATGKGDGWRYDVLPTDAQAYREGLDRLAASGFCEMDEAGQDAVLREMDAVRGSAEMRWFEEVRGDAAVAYAGHPQTLERMGYSGLGVGGATTKYKGYVQVTGGREDWEPESKPETSGELE